MISILSIFHIVPFCLLAKSVFLRRSFKISASTQHIVNVFAKVGHSVASRKELLHSAASCCRTVVVAFRARGLKQKSNRRVLRFQIWPVLF
jgi:hypothetical protein